jgi:hypothetical protein
MLSSDATSENEKKKSLLLLNVSFLMNFLKVVTKKTCHTTYTKALLVKKNGPKLPYFEEKNV